MTDTPQQPASETPKFEGDVKTDGPKAQPFFIAETQEDLNKKVGNVRGEGRGSGRVERERELLTATGASSIDELVSAYGEYRAIQQATETEVERLQRELKERDDAVAEEKRLREESDKRVEQTLVNTKLETALVGAKIDPKRIPKILGDASLPAPKVENGKVEGVDAFVAAATEEYPEWFGTRETVPVTPDGNDDGAKSVTQSYMDRKYARDKKNE